MSDTSQRDIAVLGGHGTGPEFAQAAGAVPRAGVEHIVPQAAGLARRRRLPAEFISMCRRCSGAAGR